MFKSKQTLPSQPLPTGLSLQVLICLTKHFLDLFQHVHVYLLLRSPGQDLALQVCSHHLPQPAGDCLTNVAQDTLGFHCLQGHLAGLCTTLCTPLLSLSFLPMLLGYVGTAGSHLIEQSSQPTVCYTRH